MTLPAGSEAVARPAGWRGIALKLALAVAAPLVALGALEGTLRLAGYGVATDLFIPNAEPGVYRTNPQFTAPYVPASFGIRPLSFRIRRHKAPNALRVFVVGESAAQGMPEPDYGFAALLRANLRAQFPGREVEVFNLGITAINSHVVRRAVAEASAFEPDLFVVYMGNNEVVGPYGPGCAYLSKSPPLSVIRASAWVRGTRTGQLLASLLSRLAPAGSRTPEWKGMETFAAQVVRADDPRLSAVYLNFAANLRDILESARRSGAKVVLSTVAANTRTCSPFVSLHRLDLPAEKMRAWSAAYDAGRIALDLGDGATAAYRFREAIGIDPQYAGVSYRLAELDGSREAFPPGYIDALHWDALRFRPDPAINDAIRAAARDFGDSVLLVDAAREFGSDPGSDKPYRYDAFLDHVHFTWEGNLRLAGLLDAACLRQLRGSREPIPPPLSPETSAAVLGFTPDVELRMDKTMAELTLRPPFTGQITFSRDQALRRAAIETLTWTTSADGAVAAARETVAAAYQRDSRNPALAAHVASLEAELGHLKEARKAMEEALALEPETTERTIALARILARDPQTAGRAEDLLKGALEQDPDYFSAGTALVDVWISRGEAEEGKRVLSALLQRHSQNPYLRLEYAHLLAASGDEAGADGQARSVWEADRTGRPGMAALELRVRLALRLGRRDVAEALSLEAAAFQSDDYFNNERLVQIYEARGDSARAADALLAEAASGPFDSAQHLDLAHRLAELHRTREMLDELALAQEVARIDHNASVLRTVRPLIETYRERFRGASG
ncbi:MAG TPA: hypothetical protein VGF85_13120 [Opitutaceae bacterium]|jgi:tetratricopeptide (TPR) repeat protein